MRLRLDSYGKATSSSTSCSWPLILSRIVSVDRSESRLSISKPKYSAPATKACSSGDDAHSSSQPLTVSSSTEWLTARLSMSSRRRAASAVGPTKASRSDGPCSASSKLTYVLVVGLQPAKGGSGRVETAGGALASAWPPWPVDGEAGDALRTLREIAPPELHEVGGERPRLVGEDVRDLAELVEERHLPHLARLVLLRVVEVQILQHEKLGRDVDDVHRDVERDGHELVFEQEEPKRHEHPIRKVIDVVVVTPAIEVPVACVSHDDKQRPAEHAHDHQPDHDADDILVHALGEHADLRRVLLVAAVVDLALDPARDDERHDPGGVAKLAAAQ
eukprot:2659871-Prymnesium_polylepis.1